MLHAYETSPMLSNPISARRVAPQWPAQTMAHTVRRRLKSVRRVVYSERSAWSQTMPISFAHSSHRDECAKVLSILWLPADRSE